VLDGAVLTCAEGLATDLGTRDATALLHRAPAAPALLRRFRHLIASSADVAKRTGAEMGPEANTIPVLAPGFDTKPRTPADDAPFCRFLALGSLRPRKRLDLLIEAFTRLPDLDWSLDMLGDDTADPACAAALRDMAAAPVLQGRVRIIANPDPAATEAAWLRARAFVSVADWDGAELGVGEALRRGIPVVTTREVEWLPQAAGVVCPPGDVATLSKTLRRMIFDGPLRLRMAEAAWEAGGHLPQWSEQAGRFLALIGWSSTGQTAPGRADEVAR
jgi:glycosyltransferase involved in cell wall biosynthesis